MYQEIALNYPTRDGVSTCHASIGLIGDDVLVGPPLTLYAGNVLQTPRGFAHVAELHQLRENETPIVVPGEATFETLRQIDAAERERTGAPIITYDVVYAWYPGYPIAPNVPPAQNDAQETPLAEDDAAPQTNEALPEAQEETPTTTN